MALSKKIKHDLIDIGVNLLPVTEHTRAVLGQAGIRYGEIDMNGAATAVWFNVIEYVDKNNLADVLLTALIEKYDRHLDLKQIKEDIAKLSVDTLLEHLKSIIKARQCVLFLGPHIFNCIDNNQVVSFNKYLSNQLAEELRKLRIFFDENEKDNLSYIIDRYETKKKFVSGETEKFAKKVYENGDIRDSIYRSLDKFKFPLIINTNPDVILRKFYGNDDYVHMWYDMTNTAPQTLPEDLTSKTIVYNIFGCFENEYSIVFTEKEAVDFAKKAYEKNPPIPNEIKNIVQKSYGLFLGFDFKDWHLKILFDVLDLKNKPGNYSISDENTNILEYNKEYYERQYNLTFLNNDLAKFLGLLNQ